MHLRHVTLLGAALTLGWAAPLWAAPLFPDVPENHWARDAVATLAAKGIVEGYPATALLRATEPLPAGKWP